MWEISYVSKNPDVSAVDLKPEAARNYSLNDTQEMRLATEVTQLSTNPEVQMYHPDVWVLSVLSNSPAAIWSKAREGRSQDNKLEYGQTLKLCN